MTSIGSSLRRHGFALALIAVIGVTIFLPALVREEVYVVRDHLDYFQPMRWFTAHELRAGHLPLWNPYNASGEPWLANPQTGVFYPPSWVFLALPFATAYVLYLYIHLALLGCGAYLLFSRRASQGAAMAGAIALMLSGPALSFIDVSNNLFTLAWLPLVLWCAAEGAWKRGGVALALAFLAGEPFLAGVAALMYVIVRRRRDVVASGILALGLCAIQLFPFLETLRGSDRAAGMDAALVLHDSMSWRDWLHVALPLTSPPDQQFIVLLYVGVVVIVLALLGIRRDRATAGWLALLFVAVVIASGPAWLTRLPLTLFRYPARLVPLAALAIAALAVAGWERVRPNRRWADLVLVLVIVADLLPRAQPLLRSEPFDLHRVPYDASIGARRKFIRIGNIDVMKRAQWISGYLNLFDRRFDAFTAAPVANDRYLRAHREWIRHPKAESLGAIGAAYVVTDFALPPPFLHVAQASDVDVYHYPNAWPMAALITREPLRVWHTRWQMDTSRARVTVDAEKEGVLVLLQQDGPGWRVSVDGVEAENLRVFGLFRGVQVTRGHHEVVWTYRPASLVYGALTTAITLLSSLFFLFVKHRR